MAITGSQTATVKPATSGAYLAASALYNAGFRTWALTIMTAIAGRESDWQPTRVNSTDPAGGSYGLLQINGSHNPAGGVATPSWASQILQPQQNADEAFSLAGGNSLSNLGPWALSSSPANGVIPSPTVNGYSIVPYLAQAYTATSMVSALGPASPSQIANTSSWPGTPNLSNAQIAALPANLAAETAAGGTVTGTGCNASTTSIGIPHVVTITACQLKGFLGGACIAGGGALMVTGLALVIVAAGKGKGPLSPVVETASAVRSLPLIRRVGTSS
jgi:hypothetical protein